MKFSKTDQLVRNITVHLLKGILCYLPEMIRFFSLLLLFFSQHATGQTVQNNFIIGQTIGNLPYLEYGFGYDRLGGAKMTYLDTGVVVKVIDSTAVNYKLQLSQQHVAYLPKNNFIRNDSILSQPYYLTASWRVQGDEKYDYVSVTLDEKLPYRSMQQINPSKIVVDIFGATGNTNWVTQLSTAEEVNNVYHEQIEDDVFRVIIELKHQQHWGYHIYYEGKRLVIRIKRQPKVLSLENLNIAVDAGHGGDNAGAKGIRSKIVEKNYTLLIAQQLEKALLEEKASVLMTRTTDTSLSMTDRILRLQQEDPDFLISIHLNSSSKDSISGTSTYYRYIGFRPLSQFILQHLQELGLKEFGNIGSFNFALSGPTEYPNCLVEVAFLSNPDDEQLILDPEFHKAVAAQIVAGIKEWLQQIESTNH